MNETICCAQCAGRVDWLAHTAEAIMRIAEATHPRGSWAANALAAQIAREGSLEAFMPKPEPQRPMDTSDLDPETGEPFGVVPQGQVWVEVTSTRDEKGRVAFTAYYPDGKPESWHLRLSYWQRKVAADEYDVKVLTAQEAQRFHAARGAS